MHKNIKNEVLNLMFLSWLVIDSINGFLSQLGFNISISIFCKILFLLYMLKSLIFDKGQVFFLVYLVLLLILSLTTVLLSNDLLDVSTFTKSIKVVGVIIVIQYVMTYSSRLDIKQVKIISSIALLVVLFNIILGHMGYGMSQYSSEEGGSGTRGFFISGNELNFTFIMLAFVFLKIVYLESLSRFVLSACGLLIMAVLIGSKTPIFGLVLILVLISFNKLSSFLMLSFFCCLISFLSYLYIPLVHSSLNALIDLSLHNISRYPNLLDAITSGRLGRIIIFLDECTSSISCMLIGSGLGNASESDFFDLFLWYGLIYTLLILLFYSKVLATSIFKYSIWMPVVCVVFFIALFAGHAVYSMMAAPFLALALTVPRWCQCKGNSTLPCQSPQKFTAPLK